MPKDYGAIRFKIIKLMLQAIDALEREGPMSINAKMCHAKVTELVWVFENGERAEFLEDLPNIKACLDLEPSDWEGEKIKNIKELYGSWVDLPEEYDDEEGGKETKETVVGLA